MFHIDARPFRPTALSDHALSELIRCIENARPHGMLDLCRSLRALADTHSASNSGAATVEHLRLAVAASLLGDLCEQDWAIEAQSGEITVSPPDWTHARGRDVERIKSRVRNSLQVASDRQIATNSVKEFIRSMHRNRVVNGKIVSVSSLVDSGEELSNQLREMGTLEPFNRNKALGRLLKPYIQVCDDESVCEHTGFGLLDIWRYFRHTWSLEYNPLPGRTLRFLVRNKARPNHPVIGIAMLASPAANLYLRDEWIGWRLEDLIQGLFENRLDACRVAAVLWATLTEAIDDIRSNDLIPDDERQNPTEETLFKLRQIAGVAHRQRREDLMELTQGEPTDSDRVIDIRTFDKRRIEKKDWHRLSETPLFVKKRAEQLIPLLRALAFLKGVDFENNQAAALYELLVHREGRNVVSFILTELRKRKLATEVADLAVCGAIAPYNELLGGKLVALLMASEDARKIYSERYRSQESEIASQMAGRSIIRSADLKLVTTTSLYGVSSSQYNRLKVNISDKKKSQAVSFQYLGKTKGFTITHLSRRTVGLMRQLGVAAYGARRINSVFGEGSSPRTRQIREGLNLIGINDDGVLRQSIGRRVYGCEIFPGARAALSGFEATKKSSRGASIAAISEAWIDRWLAHRVLNGDVLDRLRTFQPSVIAKAFQDRVIRGELDLSDDANEPQFDLASPEEDAPSQVKASG